jgi:hypothetical protein
VCVFLGGFKSCLREKVLDKALTLVKVGAYRNVPVARVTTEGAAAEMPILNVVIQVIEPLASGILVNVVWRVGNLLDSIGSTFTNEDTTHGHLVPQHN